MDSTVENLMDGETRSSIGTLIAALSSLLTRVPTTSVEAIERKSSIAIAREGLSEFGLDAESFVRYALPAHIGVTVIALVLLEPESAEVIGEFRESAKRWRQVLQVSSNVTVDSLSGPDTEAARDELQREFQRIQPTVSKWIASAPFADLVDLVAPTEDELVKYELEGLPSTDITSGYVWVYERSIGTDVERWADDSLRFEYRHRNSMGKSLFPETVLSEPGPPIDSLTEEIANRFSTPREYQANATDNLIWQIQDQAQTLLRQHKHAEASALFEFYYRLHPESSQAQNNLAFCKLPIDPGSALHHLQQAERGGFHPLAINIYNQVCALTILSREAEALDRAEYYWQREYESEKIGGYLWRMPEGGDPQLYYDQDVKVALATIALQLAKLLGRSGRAAKWQERIDGLCAQWAIEDAQDTPQQPAA